MSEIRPSVEIKKDILLKESQITSVSKTLETLRRPFVTLSSLQKQMDELKKRIEEEKDDRIVARLKRQLESLSSQYDNVKKSITRELEQKVKEVEISIEKLNSELESLKKELSESLKVEEEIRIRNSRTVVRQINLGNLLGGSSGDIIGTRPQPIGAASSYISLTVEKGQKIEYLRSLDSGNLYMKISKLTSFANFEGTVKNVNYKSIFVQEKEFNDFIPQPDTPIKDFPKLDSVNSTGSETFYYTQVTDFQTELNISVGLGFITIDVDRQDGDLSVWVLLSSGGKAVAEA